MIRIFLVLIGLNFFQSKAIASEEVVAGKIHDEAQEIDLAKKAKKRLYPGGRDESDLKIQAEITNPTRKMAPQAELKVEEPAEE
jgi:hypothetical protein